jgi:hypothetical protein
MTTPSPVIALDVSPKPITYVSLPPRAQPGQPTPSCCFTLDATWALVVSSNRQASVSSQHIQILDVQSGRLLAEADTLETGAVGRSIPAGQRTSIEMRWLGEVGSAFQRSSRLHMRLAVTLDLGEGVRSDQVVETDWVE